MSSLEEADAAAAAVQTTPNRVTLRKLVEVIAAETYFTLGRAQEVLGMPKTEGADIFTICAITTTNGFTVVGKSAPVDPANFDEVLGRRFAYEDAVRQLWPLEGYLLRNKLAAQEEN